MPRSIDLLDFFGQMRCQEFVAQERDKPSFRTDPIRGCWLSSTSLTPEGYARISKKTNSTIARELRGLSAPHVDSKSGFVTVLLHRVAFVSRSGENVPDGQQASHVCDEPNCFNPSHVVAEDALTNASRKACVQIRCPHHDYAIVLDLCRHAPRCIKRPPEPSAFHCCAVASPGSS